MSPEERLRVIILAAGAGRRLGRDKATLPWGPGILLAHVLGQFPAWRVGRCVVVANPQNHALLQEFAANRVHVVVNPDPTSEMIVSVRLGVEELREQHGPLIIHPVDVFAITAELVGLLHEAWRADRDRVHVPVVGGKGAHPLLLPPRYAREINELPPGAGLNHVLREHAVEVVRHPWPDARLLVDLDRPEDYFRYRPDVP